MLWWTIQKLKSSDWHVRAEAARALAAAGNPKAVPALIKALDDAVGNERSALIEALGILGHQAAVEPLTAALQNQPRRIKDLRGKSSTPSQENEYRSLAEALAKIGSASLSPLMGLLGSDDKDVRRWASHGLGLLKDARAFEPLVGRLQDARSDVRQSAARALGELGDRRAVQPLIKVLAGRDPDSRSAAAEALGMIGTEEALEPLAAAARDPNEPLQLAAIRALQRIGGLRAGTRIRTVMEVSKKAVREAAVAALGAMTFESTSAENRAAAAVLRGDFDAALREGPASAESLVSALDSRDQGHRLKAIRALRALHSERALQALQPALDDNDRLIQEAAAEALADFGTAAVPVLLDSLKSEHLSVRGLAAKALRTIGDARAAGPLIEMLTDLRGRLKDESGAAEAAQSAASALEAILLSSSASFSDGELSRLAALSARDASRSATTSQSLRPADGIPEMGRIGELARQELERRGTR